MVSERIFNGLIEELEFETRVDESRRKLFLMKGVNPISVL